MPGRDVAAGQSRGRMKADQRLTG